MSRLSVCSGGGFSKMWLSESVEVLCCYVRKRSWVEVGETKKGRVAFEGGSPLPASIDFTLGGA